MKSKLMWFYQDMEEVEVQPTDINKPSTSRQLAPNASRINAAPQAVVSTLKKKLFLTNGMDVALTGICIYIFRIHKSKQLPEEGFQKVTEKFLITEHLRVSGF